VPLGSEYGFALLVVEADVLIEAINLDITRRPIGWKTVREPAESLVWGSTKDAGVIGRTGDSISGLAGRVNFPFLTSENPHFTPKTQFTACQYWRRKLNF
jgi:hypothetical protein